ncbi:twin-arginine translocation signal domain-containing protein [Kineococcus sp. SYSU DK002]|uniref:twin-arginine translocation signal domain-containing protein n=1 Tax=Kineococcus sp. SYSU DK002 TaxID=3383123 RepID=UPI003D7DF5EA
MKVVDEVLATVTGFLATRTSRRGFLARTAVVGSALTVSPWGFLTRPQTAYAAVCGIDSTCSSGYTVFCATVNNGVNRCPPGSLVGGWWKSDGSGYCCGGARYYIDCHSYCSCGCGGRRKFCGEGCRNCSCGCGPAGQCDQRKVCCNEFRYGQCNQDTGCTGPVWCRVVTCTPPWRIPAWNCTTTSATDQRTNAHTAPALRDCTPIGREYTAIGGPGSVLGEQRTPELGTPGPGGTYQLFDHGSIYHSPGTGAHEVHGLILEKFGDLGWEAGVLGYPTTDELSTPDGRGRFNHFERGSVYWTPGTGANAVVGAIREAWKAWGWEAGPLGYPVTDELGTPDGRGRFNHFQGRRTGGSVYWTPATGAQVVLEEIRDAWARLGWETGRLGFPVTSQAATPDGRALYNHFERGSIYSSPATGAHAVAGAVRDLWAAAGWETGPLGLPTTDETAVAGGGSQDFEGGSVYLSPATGAHTVTGPVRTAFRSAGGPARWGFPAAEPETAGGGRVRQRFERGTAVLTTATGAVIFG